MVNVLDPGVEQLGIESWVLFIHLCVDFGKGIRPQRTHPGYRT